MRLLIFFTSLFILVPPAISNRNAQGTQIGSVSSQRACFQSSRTLSQSTEAKVTLAIDSTILKRSHNGNNIKIILGPAELVQKASGSKVSNWTKY